MVEHVKKEKGAYGFDAAKDEYVDLIKAGIIDPTKVVRLALQNASSVVSLMITTQAMVAEKKAPMLPPFGYFPAQPDDESRPNPSFHTERQYREWPEPDLLIIPWEKSRR